MARVAMMEGMKLRWEKARAENNNDEDRAKHPLKLQSIIDQRNPDDNLTKRRTLILYYPCSGSSDSPGSRMKKIHMEMRSIIPWWWFRYIEKSPRRLRDDRLFCKSRRSVREANIWFLLVHDHIRKILWQFQHYLTEPWIAELYVTRLWHESWWSSCQAWQNIRTN